MRKNLKLFLLLLPVLLIFSSGLFAQAQKGTLKIVLVDEEGTPLPGVTAVLSSPVLMGAKQAISDDRGEVLFINLTPGVYDLKSTLQGFQEKTSSKIEVSLDRQTLVQVVLKPATIEESVTVVAVSPAVDTTKSVIAEHITHEAVESLPVSRDFVGYLQLAAGVNVVPNSQGRDTPQDPAGKGGLNYADRGLQGSGAVKRGSRDNYYFIDGTDITGLSSQRAGMSFNNEVIQEQELMTSGVPAEYGGGKGVVGNIVTKSGGNQFSGSVNFYYQPKQFYLPFGGSAHDSAATPSMLEGYKDNKYDTAATLGGPLWKDRLWFFVSGQYRNDANKFNLSQSASATQEEVDYTNKRTGLFGKATFKLTPNDSFSLLYFLDAYTIEGTRDQNTIKTRQPIDDYDMGVYSAYYQRVFGDNVILDVRYGHYRWANVWGPRYEDAGYPDSLYYVPGTYPPVYDFTFGGYATRGDYWQSRDQINGNLEWYLGNMRFKGGLAYTNEYSQQEAKYFYGDNRSSLDPNLQGQTLGYLIDNLVWPPSEYYQRLLPYLNANWGPTSAAYDFDHNGVLSDAELRQATFTDMGEHGVNFWRIMDAKVGSNKVRAQRYFGYLMDDWKLSDSFTLNAGVRLEKHDYFDAEGGTILKMPVRALPRIGLVWNIGGSGRQKVNLFYGQFSDPMPFGMIHFAGNISGRITHEQMWLNGDWYSYRVRGSAEVRDCAWTPNTRDNYAHEFSLTYETDLGNQLVIGAQGYFRSERNIVEDYDLFTYVTGGFGPTWAEYSLTYEDFGFGPEGPSGPANYFLSNLIGAKRDIYGFDFEISKRFSDGSYIVGQYSYKDARGNSQSDGNADLQGDFIEIDPRTPWMWGPTPGTIPHKLKLFGTYRTPIGLYIGGLLYWNSGMVYTESYDFLPGRYSIYINWPLNDAWTDFAQTGQQMTKSYYQIDLKLNYYLKLFQSVTLDLFLDAYNVTNNQAPIDLQYARNDSTWDYQETTELLLPMRFYIGARIRF